MTRRLELKAIKAAADQLSGAYVFETGKNEKIEIRYEKRGDQVTRIAIRVGVFGDERLSRVLLDEIKRDLP